MAAATQFPTENRNFGSFRFLFLSLGGGGVGGQTV